MIDVQKCCDCLVIIQKWCDCLVIILRSCDNFEVVTTYNLSSKLLQSYLSRRSPGWLGALLGAVVRRALVRGGIVWQDGRVRAHNTRGQSCRVPCLRSIVAQD